VYNNNVLLLKILHDLYSEQLTQKVRQWPHHVTQTQASGFQERLRENIRDRLASLELKLKARPQQELQ
jgi:hypothetical protein